MQFIPHMWPWIRSKSSPPKLFHCVIRLDSNISSVFPHVPGSEMWSQNTFFLPLIGSIKSQSDVVQCFALVSNSITPIPIVLNLLEWSIYYYIVKMKSSAISSCKSRMLWQANWHFKRRSKERWFNVENKELHMMIYTKGRHKELE